MSMTRPCDIPVTSEIIGEKRGYKGNNDRGKGKNRTCGKAYWCSRQKITKQKVGENRCNDISFRPLSSRDYPF